MEELDCSGDTAGVAGRWRQLLHPTEDIDSDVSHIEYYGVPGQNLYVDPNYIPR